MYWDVVLQEVLNKNSPGYIFVFTSLSDYLAHKAIKQEQQTPRHSKSYFLGDKYQNIYLTKREAECVLYMLTGCGRKTRLIRKNHRILCPQYQSQTQMPQQSRTAGAHKK